jgi:hypothetical protein
LELLALPMQTATRHGHVDHQLVNSSSSSTSSSLLLSASPTYTIATRYRTHDKRLMHSPMWTPARHPASVLGLDHASVLATLLSVLRAHLAASSPTSIPTPSIASTPLSVSPPPITPTPKHIRSGSDHAFSSSSSPLSTWQVDMRHWFTIEKIVVRIYHHRSPLYAVADVVIDNRLPGPLPLDQLEMILAPINDPHQMFALQRQYSIPGMDTINELRFTFRVVPPSSSSSPPTTTPSTKLSTSITLESGRQRIRMVHTGLANLVETTSSPDSHSSHLSSAHQPFHHSSPVSTVAVVSDEQRTESQSEVLEYWLQGHDSHESSGSSAPSSTLTSPVAPSATTVPSDPYSMAPAPLPLPSHYISTSTGRGTGRFMVTSAVAYLGPLTIRHPLPHELSERTLLVAAHSLALPSSLLSVRSVPTLGVPPSSSSASEIPDLHLNTGEVKDVDHNHQQHAPHHGEEIGDTVVSLEIIAPDGVSSMLGLQGSSQCILRVTTPPQHMIHGLRIGVTSPTGLTIVPASLSSSASSPECTATICEVNPSSTTTASTKSKPVVVTWQSTSGWLEIHDDIPPYTQLDIIVPLSCSFVNTILPPPLIPPSPKANGEAGAVTNMSQFHPPVAATHRLRTVLRGQLHRIGTTVSSNEDENGEQKSTPPLSLILVRNAQVTFTVPMSLRTTMTRLEHRWFMQVLCFLIPLAISNRSH